MRIRRTIALVSFAAGALSACGGSSDEPVAAGSGDETSSTVDAAAPGGAAFNDADVDFAQSMIPHHEQAIELADIALDPAIGASAEVQALANQIKAAQDPEIDQMKGLLTGWGKPTQMEMNEDHDMSAMEGMLSADDISALEATTGAEFDKAWATLMIDHHKGAIVTAEAAKAAGSSPEISTLADAVIADQSAEIEVLTPIAG